jgi:hypothetical protein
MPPKSKPDEPDKFSTPRPEDLPDDRTSNPADISGPHGPGSEPWPEDEEVVPTPVPGGKRRR